MANRSDYADIECPRCGCKMILITFQENGIIYADYLECPECFKKECVSQDQITYGR